MAPETDCKRLVAVWGLLGLCLLATALMAMSHPARKSEQNQEDVKDGDSGQDAYHKPSLFNLANYKDKFKKAYSSMPSIFDFANYKRLFKRTYSGFLDELNRQRLFFARALRVFIAAVNYKHAKQLYYLAINKFSDATREELDRMRNRVLSEQAGRGSSDQNETKEPALDDIDLGESIEAGKLGELIKEQPKELDKLLVDGEGEPRRKKRSLRKKSRKLDSKKLVNTGSIDDLSPELQDKVLNMWYGSSTDHEPVSYDQEDDPVERVSPKSSRKFKLSSLFKFGKTSKKSARVNEDENGYGSSYESENGSDSGNGPENEYQYEDEPQLPDETLFDLRTKSNCFFPPRSQSQCGACYAFAMVTIAEWHHCIKFGSLVAFSEQYVVDCGKSHGKEIDGCDGGDQIAVGEFVNMFGLELRSEFPYAGREMSCQYKKSTPPNTMGFMSMKTDRIVSVPLSELAEHIKIEPIFLVILTDQSFAEYGGGIHGTPGTVPTRGVHAMVLVGHGRENGREYWLIRNSHGTGWGEGGYYKLDKATDNIVFRQGYIYVTKKGKERLDLSLNLDNRAALEYYQAVMSSYHQPAIFDQSFSGHM